jgi:hypothetical protein
MTLLAEIANGERTFADVLFLVAFILAVIAMIVRVIAKPIPIDMVLMAAAVAALSLGWLVL